MGTSGKTHPPLRLLYPSHPPPSPTPLSLCATLSGQRGLGLGFLLSSGRRRKRRDRSIDRSADRLVNRGRREERRRRSAAMTGKAKPKKHTAKEIASKVDAATTNRGGGKAGQADRTGQDKGGHAKLECPLCKITVPDVKSMQIHHEARHPKQPFDESKIINLHVSHAPETSKPRPGVRGSFKK